MIFVRITQNGFAMERSMIHRRIIQSMNMFDSAAEPIGKAIAVGQMDDQLLVQAHRYILRHCDELDGLHREFVDQEKRKQCNLNLMENGKTDLIRRHFADWLEQKVILDNGPDITEKVRASAAKPRKRGVLYSGYIINGFRFHIMSHETGRVTQNSRVLTIAENGVSYYGWLSDIFELSYRDYKVVFFKCYWYDVRHKAGLM